MISPILTSASSLHVPPWIKLCSFLFFRHLAFPLSDTENWINEQFKEKYQLKPWHNFVPKDDLQFWISLCKSGKLNFVNKRFRYNYCPIRNRLNWYSFCCLQKDQIKSSLLISPLGGGGSGGGKSHCMDGLCAQDKIWYLGTN